MTGRPRNPHVRRAMDRKATQRIGQPDMWGYNTSNLGKFADLGPLTTVNTPAVVAFDLSLTATGWASGLDTYGVLVPPKGQDRGLPRLRWIRSAVLDRVPAGAVVVLEGYAYARANQAHQLGELGGVVRLALDDAGIPFIDIAPKTVKKLACGKGNAGKPEVLAAAIRRLGFTGHDNNVADALWLFVAGTVLSGADIGVSLPQAQRDALTAVSWPRRRAA